MKHLRVASRCAEDWDAMPGSLEKRFCDVCEKDVHYLSALREADARALLASHAADGKRICIRVARDREGRALFRSEPEPPSAVRVAVRGAAASALTTLILTTACSAAPGVHDARIAPAASPPGAVDHDMGDNIPDDVDVCPDADDGGPGSCPEGQ
jgi:hypothetical protein